LGVNAGANLTTGDNNIDIGYNVQGVAGESNTIRIGNTDITDTYIGGISGATVDTGALPVYVDAFGHLGTVVMGANGKSSTAPVRRSKGAHPQAMINSKFSELQATVAQQQKQIETLTAQLKEQAAQFTTQLKEQAAQIQKVSAQLEMSKPAAKVVVNKP